MTDDIAAIAEGLTGAQRDWIMSAPEGEHPCTDVEYMTAPPFYVQLSPDEYCEETGCYLGGGQRYWFASGTATGTAHGWEYRYGLDKRGLVLRAYLENRHG